MRLFKKLTLLFTSLLVVAASFSFTKPSSLSSSVQGKSFEYQFAAVTADDIDDDFDDSEFEIFYELATVFSQRNESSFQQKFFQGFSGTRLSIPVFLQIRNLRI